MISLKNIFRSGAKNPRDILAVHFGHTGTYCARLRAGGEKPALLAADILPPVRLPDETSMSTIPKPLIAQRVAICIPSDDVVVKLLHLPGQLEGDVTEQVWGSLGLDREKFRMGYRTLTLPTVRNRTETKVLAVAAPEHLAQAACGIFRTGIPAPISLEADGLAALTNFSLAVPAMHTDEDIGCIISCGRVSFAAFFRKGELLLIRKFDFGLFHLLDMMHKDLGVDHSTARDILVNGSFDVSQMVKSAMEPFVKQLVISKHFIERRNNCHVSRMFVAVEDWMAREWMAEIKSGVGVEIVPWNPLEAVTIQSGALPPAVEPQAVRLSVAVGAALGLFEEN